MDTRERLEALRKFQRLLDSAFRIPGTAVRFGWDPILGLVPGLGDLLTALFALAVLIQANQLRVPKVIQLRMVANTLVDMALGVVPFLGDVTDVFWKSNAKNFALLERHAGGLSKPTAADWAFVVAIVAAGAALALIPLVALYWVVDLMTTPVAR